MVFSLSPFAPEKLVLQDGFGPVPSCVRPLIHQTQAESSAFLPLSTKTSTYIPSTTIGLAPNLSDHAIACRWRSLPRVRWHSACNIPLSTMRYVKRKNTKPRFELSTDSSIRTRQHVLSAREKSARYAREFSFARCQDAAGA